MNTHGHHHQAKRNSQNLLIILFCVVLVVVNSVYFFFYFSTTQTNARSDVETRITTMESILKQLEDIQLTYKSKFQILDTKTSELEHSLAQHLKIVQNSIEKVSHNFEKKLNSLNSEARKTEYQAIDGKQQKMEKEFADLKKKLVMYDNWIKKKNEEEATESTWKEFYPLAPNRLKHTVQYQSPHLYVFGGEKQEGDQVKLLNKVDILQVDPLDFTSSLWLDHNKTAEIPFPFSQGSSFILNEKIFLFGGITDEGMNDKIFILSLATHSWGVKPNTWKFPRKLFSTHIVQHNKVVVVGGVDMRQEPIQKMEVFDVFNNQWTELATFPAEWVTKGGRKGYCTAVVGNSIFFIGGEFNGAAIASIDSYDVETQKWKSWPDASIPRKTVSCTSQKNLIYVLGGENNDGLRYEVEVFDTSKGVWDRSKKSSLIFPCKYCSVSSLQHKNIIAIGGNDQPAKNVQFLQTKN